MPTDPHAFALTLDGMIAQVWSMLQRGVHDRHAAARHPVLATVSADGLPQARTVVLRAADRAAGTLQVYTDLKSAKVADLRATPRAALHVWDSRAHLQIRLAAKVTILSGADVRAIWEKLPDPSRLAYGVDPAPGEPIDAALSYARHPDAPAFGVLHLEVQAMDVLHLGPDHRRAQFLRHDDWSGNWCAP